MITILAVGKKTDRNLADAIYDYERRLDKPFDVKWVLIPYSAKNGSEARQDESERLLDHIKPGERVLLLDERGRDLTSPEFSAQLVKSNWTIVIGGAYGVDEALRRRADLVMSLSHLVFPHQLVRLILMEQIYRAQAIYHHHPYHHN